MTEPTDTSEQRAERWTRGPWYVRHTIPNLYVYSDRGHYVASVGPTVSPAREPNAHLIAQSPVMYDFVEWMLKLVTDRQSDIPSDTGEMIAHEATSILAAARGEV